MSTSPSIWQAPEPLKGYCDMMRIVRPLALTVAMFTICGTSYAAVVQWNVNGAACIADAGAIQGNLYIGTGGTVKFASGKTGRIVLYCPVSDKLGFKPDLIGLTYYDDSAIADNHVTAQYIAMDIDTGAIATIATADSNFGAVSSNGKAGKTAKTFNVPYIPNDFAYYLRVDIIRNATTANETVYSVTLQGH